MIVHTFNPSTREAESRWISEFKASLDYRARTNQRNLASENKQRKRQDKKERAGVLPRSGTITFGHPSGRSS